MVPFGRKASRYFSRRKKNRSTGKKQGARSSDKLAFETLEPRQMLATDLAQISGVVQTDLQGDGDSSNDVVVVGATATLYRDGGNGTFGGDDTVAGTAVTDAQGRYRFDSVGAGQYFIKISLPSGLQFLSGEDVHEVVITADEGDGVVGPTIDGFTSTQKVQAAPPLPSSEPSHRTDPGVLGGERDLYVELTAGDDQFSSVSLVSGGGLMRLSSDSMVTGNAKIVWDGVDGNASTVNPTGLGGMDLTQSGGNTMTGISLTSGADHPNAKITMRIYSDANNWSEFTTTVPESQGGAATGEAIFRFDDPPTAVSGNGADFTNVGALELTFEGVSAVDGQVALVGLVGRANKTADFTALPRLSLGDKVWADEDDNGRLDSGEQGVAGVAVNLYEDTDGNNEYTAGVDRFLESQATDAAGNYMFTDLLPGDYLVQVDPSNFRPEGPLAGLVSSAENDPASDPDNNVDNDDNGIAVAGAGVVSQAITLLGETEPTDDGDANNSNRTLDFGFFGFDLELTKAVEQGTVTPGETLSYTITITNDGPSAAALTTFEDVLPDHAQFVSASTNIDGVSLKHSDGVITADLGTLAPGQVVTIEVIAEVRDSAENSLVNEATVFAPKELNLSNNSDTVSNPVSPRIDLAITKSDSHDPVEPGSTFSYTLHVVNNGPSNATGVVVTDHLPAEVTYVDSSIDPSAQTGDELTFTLGDLGRGKSRSITIQVQVDQAFQGELLNHTTVRGNETELTLANNEDLEPTLVKFDPASLGGSVFVDANNNGKFDSGEAPLGDVSVTLKGIDFTGTSLVRSTTTLSDGSYHFGDLMPGNYRVVESQPTAYNDGKDHLGSHGGVHGMSPGPHLIPQDDTQMAHDLFFEINLQSGDNAEDYDFGELAHSTSKINYIRSANW